MDKRKVERSFDYLEKSILIEIVTEHFGVIESKKTDGVSIKLKNVEWQRERNSLQHHQLTQETPIA